MTDTREMPRYKSHKQVWALKIAAWEPTPDGGIITPAEPGYGPVAVDAAYVERHRPQVGGYYVVYDDGYKSWSPAAAFEAGYSAVS